MPLSRCPAGVDAGRWDERRHRSEKFYRTRSMWYGMLRGSREPYMHDDENLTTERPTFVTHLECSATGERYPADVLHNLSRAGKPLLVRYDLAAARKALSKEALARRPHDLWRYRELLPVRRAQDIVSLGEAVTPLVAMRKLAAAVSG